jgi:hypothetical protein
MEMARLGSPSALVEKEKGAEYSGDHQTDPIVQLEEQRGISAEVAWQNLSGT